MRHGQAEVFFHEFGHAIHNLMGRSQFFSQCGNRVTWDFVEMPSQLLEEWMWDPMILKEVSSHYLTGESLPDTLLENMLRARGFGRAVDVKWACFLSQLGLELFDRNTSEDPTALMHRVWAEELSHSFAAPNNHYFASWTHVSSYGPRYYSYLWSQVFALDLFDQIRQEGLLNPAAGKRFAKMILSKGGGRDPNLLLRDYLGREPNLEPFLRRLKPL
jgi:thimet oligopeptidase